MQASYHIVIVGAGFTGTAVAIHLIRSGPRGLHVSLVEARPRLGRGLAYATAVPAHVLNTHPTHQAVLERNPRHGTGFEPHRRRPAAFEQHRIEEHGPFRGPTDAAATPTCSQRSESSPEVMLGLCLLATMLAGAVGLVATIVAS